jgi:carboxynorspermidine decarboxylase
MAATESAIQTLIEANRRSLRTPYYLIDESALLKNLERVAALRERTGVRSVLALKCFATWAVFDLMRPYLDGTTSSSLYEARLGHDKFGKEVHAYSVAFSDDEIDAVRPIASKIIFNSTSQLRRFGARVAGVPLGLRVNPGVSYSRYDLADPARTHSRLGVSDDVDLAAAADAISGVMFHCNCENGDLDALRGILNHIGGRFGSLLERLDWVSLGGGISFTSDTYPFDAFCDTLAAFAARFKVQLYLEPGSAVVTRSGYLVTQVLDIVNNGVDVAIVDAGQEAHMLDFLIYGMSSRIEGLNGEGAHTYAIAGRSCLAGDTFGTFTFEQPLQVGSLLALADAADYTIVKKNWFNGLAMPSIVVRRLSGELELIRSFEYEEYLRSQS